jgi:tetratricopeptide (TPR) repeat protein
MHRLFLAFSISVLAVSIVLTGCTQSSQPQAALAQVKDDEKVPSGEAKPIPKGDPDDPSRPAPDTKTDPETLPVLPKLNEPTGEDKYEAAMTRAFMLMAEKKDAEALAALKEAKAAQETDFVKSEIARLEARIAKNDAAQKAADDIKEVLDDGDAAQAATLATDALAQFGDTDLAETITSLKRQADALVGAGLEGKARGQKFFDEAEAARKANNIRAAVVAYEQAIAAGAEPGELKETYETLRTRLTRYDDNRTRAAELRKDPMQLEQARTVLKAAAENWDTPQVRQEIAEVENAIDNRRDRVAIADFEEINDIGVPRAGHVVAEELMNHMRPRFDLVERSQVKALLAEMKLDADDLAVNDTARTEFGNLAKARYIVVGSVNRLGGIHVNARLVDTQTGLVAQTARIVAATPEEMSDRLQALGRMLQMTDDEKRSYERELAEKAKPVEPPKAVAEIPPPPPAPAPEVVVAPPPPIVMFTPRPPVFGAVVAADFGRFRVVAAAAAPPPPIVFVEAPVLVRDRAFFVAIDVGDNFFRRGMYREALRHFEFALAINPGHAGIRFRVQMCRPFCPPVVVPILRPRLVVLPFAEFRDPFAGITSIPPGLGIWTAEALAPYFYPYYDVVSMGEVYWWMGRLGLTLRDVLVDPYARLILGRAVGARFFLMGALTEVASFDASTHIIDSELNIQTHGAKIRVQNAAELRFRLPQLARLTLMPPQQQVVVIQQQQVVQRKVVAAQLEYRNGNFAVSLGLFKEVLAVDPHHVEARQLMLQVEFRSRRHDHEKAQILAFQQRQAQLEREREKRIALEAATQAAKIQAKKDAAKNKQLISQQQLLAQQNLLAQAQLAQRQNNLEQRVALLESANALKADPAIVDQLAQAKAELAAEKEKRLAAEKALRETELKKQKDDKLAAAAQQLAAAKQKQLEEKEARQKAAEAKTQAEYDRFLDIGQKAMTAQNYAQAATAFQNARRLKPSSEIEKLISSALTEQARADAEKKGAAEKKKLEAELVKEEQRNKELEAENIKLKARYQAAFDKGQSAMKAKQYDEAVTSFRLASKTIQTDEAAAALKQAQAELAKANETARAEAKKKAEEEQKQKAIAKRLAEGRQAMTTKKYDQAVAAFRAAASLKPGDVEIQKLLTEAELARDQALAAARKEKEPVVPKKDPDAERKMALYTAAMKAAQSAFDAKQYDDAIAKAQEALRVKPGDTAATQLLTAARKADKSADAAAMEAKKKQEAYLAAMRDASSAYAAKKYEAAIKAANEALSLKPKDAAATKILNDSQKALDDAKAAAMEAEKKQQAYAAAIKKGRAAMAAKKYDDAIAAFNDALKADPGDPTATALLKQARDAQAAMAADAKRKALYEQWMDRAEALMKARKYEDAVEAYQNALKAMPDDAAAKRGLAEARAAMTPKKDPKVDPKPKDPKKDPKEDPNAARVAALLKQAAAQENAGRYAQAYETYQDVLKLSPTNATAKTQAVFCQWMDQGVRQLSAGKKDEAAASFEQALKIDPTDANAKRLLAQAREKPKEKPKKK